jgi:PAT family beta-lactamase induction signal transducer AmpG
LPLALTSGTLQAWLTVAGLDLKTIGIFTLVGLPYTVKFLWAPLMDRLVPPWLGRRRGWMLVTQMSVALGLAAMAVTGPGQRPERVSDCSARGATRYSGGSSHLRGWCPGLCRLHERGSGR